MKPTSVTVTLAPTTTTNYVCLSQALLAAGNLVLNGGGAVAVTNQLMGTGAITTVICDTNANCRQLTIISISSDESGKTFTVYGRMTKYGPIVNEVITGPGGGATVTSVNYFYEVTRIAVSAALTANVSVGVNAVGASQAIPVDHYQNPFNVNQSMSTFSTSGTPNFTVQHASHQVNITDEGSVPATWFDDATAAAKTSNFESQLLLPVRAIRLKNNSGSGSCTLTLTQAGPA